MDKAEIYLTEHGIESKFAKEEFRVTWDENNLYLPIEDINGKELWIKERNLNFDSNHPNGEPKFKNHGVNTIFNTKRNIDATSLFLFEGEWDAVKAIQDGIPAISMTSGAATITIPEEYEEFIKSKKLYICYDNDEAGQQAVIKLKELLSLAIFITLPEGIKDYCEYRKQYSLTNFQELVKQQTKEQTLDFKGLCDVLDKWLLLPDKNAIKIILSTVISHYFSNDPLWMFLVAPPSGTKTELLSALSELPKVFALSDLTPQTLASGLNYRTDPSLLARLKDNILIMKDFTTVLSMRYEERQVILSQLREIYDGKYHKEFGSGKTVDWEGKITLLAGVTPFIDTQLSIFQVMGERFLMYRMSQANDIDVAEKAIMNSGQEKVMRKELTDAFNKFFKQVAIVPTDQIELPKDILTALSSLASLIVIMRSTIIRNAYSREIEYIPVPEAPARFAKALVLIMKMLATLEMRNVISWNDYYLGMRVAFDAISRNTISHFIGVCKKEGGKTSEIATETKYSHAGSERLLEDLAALKLITAEGEGIGVTKYWLLSDKSKKYLKQILPNKDEKIIEIFPEGDIYWPIIEKVFELNEKIAEQSFIENL